MFFSREETMCAKLSEATCSAVVLRFSATPKVMHERTMGCEFVPLQCGFLWIRLKLNTVKGMKTLPTKNKLRASPKVVQFLFQNDFSSSHPLLRRCVSSCIISSCNEARRVSQTLLRDSRPPASSRRAGLISQGFTVPSLRRAACRTSLLLWAVSLDLRLCLS